MVAAYKLHFHFILSLVVLYVVGVWGGPIIYALLPIALLLFGTKNRFFELFILTIWMLILSDYVPVANATHDDLQFAKDLKPLMPLFLFGMLLRSRNSYRPLPRVFLYFVPFFVIALLSSSLGPNPAKGIQKTISFILMYLCVPFFVVYLHKQYKEMFWKSLLTFVIGMLMIGIVLKFAAPDIGNLSTGRFKGVFGNPNGLGLFLNLIFVLWIVISEFKLATFTRKENNLIFIVLLLSLIWCGSRNAMTSMILFYVVHKIIKVNWFLALVAVAALLILNDPFFELLIDIIEFFGLEEFFRIESIEEGSGRKIAWVFGWSQIDTYYFIGGGFGYTEDLYAANYKHLSSLGHEGNAHNSYLTFWLNNGILGVIAYFGGLLTLVLRSMRHNYIVLAFLVGLSFNIMYESWLVASLNPFTIIYLTIITILATNLHGKDFSPKMSQLENRIPVSNS